MFIIPVITNFKYKMNNPFSFGVIVDGLAFCNRKKEHDQLLSYCRSSQNVMIYSHRRIGKTSLIHHVFNTLESEDTNIKKIYIDCYGILTEKQLISLVFKSLNQIETRVEKLIEFSKNIFCTVKLNFSFDVTTGNPTMSPSFQAEDSEVVLEEVFKLIEQYSKKKMVVVFDEFQEIENFKDESFEKRLRKIIQQHKNICYVFMGSKRHILTQMFNAKSRAFYQSAELFPLYPIDTPHYIKWVKKLYSMGNKVLPSDIMIENIVLRCNNYPIYVQQYFYYLWEKNQIDEKSIQDVEIDIISRSHDKFLNLWEALTLNQRKTLHLIIRSKGENIYYADMIHYAGLKSAAQVKKAVEVLYKNEIIVKNSRYHIQDIMFEKWIRKMM